MGGVDYLQYNGTNLGNQQIDIRCDIQITIIKQFCMLQFPIIQKTTTGVINFLKNITKIPNLPKRIPSNIVGVVMVGTTSYVWNGTDFVAYVATDDATSNFTLVTQFGNNVLEPLVSLDLSDVKLATIQRTPCVIQR